MTNNETKRECFVRLATKRTNKIIDSIRVLGNCGNTSTYEFTDEDIEKIFAAIDAEIDCAKKKFEKVHKADRIKFVL